MIENIVRYIEQGDRPFEAALKGPANAPIVSITFSLIAVFIPLLFMGASSAAVPRIRRRRHRGGGDVGLRGADPDAGHVRAVPEAPQPREARPAEPVGGERLRRLGALSTTAASMGAAPPVPALVSTLLLILVTGWLYITIPRASFPSRTPASSSARPRRGRTSSFVAMADIQNELSAIIQKDPGVQGVVGFVGLDRRQFVGEHRAHVHPS